MTYVPVIPLHPSCVTSPAAVLQAKSVNSPSSPDRNSSIGSLHCPRTPSTSPQPITDDDVKTALGQATDAYCRGEFQQVIETCEKVRENKWWFTRSKSPQEQNSNYKIGQRDYLLKICIDCRIHNFWTWHFFWIFSDDLNFSLSFSCSCILWMPLVLMFFFSLALHIIN